jgi:hypothetical protein
MDGFRALAHVNEFLEFNVVKVKTALRPRRSVKQPSPQRDSGGVYSFGLHPGP